MYVGGSDGEEVRITILEDGPTVYPANTFDYRQQSGQAVASV